MKLLHFVASKPRCFATFSSNRYFSSDPPSLPGRIDNVLILGAGLMGSGIAQSCACTSVQQFSSITLQDISLVQLDRARRRILQNLSARLNPDPRIQIDAPVDTVISRIKFATKIDTSPDVVANLLVIEAIPEVLQLKQSLFRNLNILFNNNQSDEPDASFPIFATCSALLSRDKIALHFDPKHRFTGLHFNPEPTSKMVKIIRTQETDPMTVELLERFVGDIGKVCIVSSDVPLEMQGKI